MRRAVLPIVFVVMGACSPWKVESSPRAALSGRGHGLVRITTTDRGTVELRDPELSHDTVFGWSDQPGARVRGRVALPLATITAVERHRKDHRPLAITAGVAVVALIALARP